MICPVCRKRIMFTVTSEPLPRFDSGTNKWYHADCLVKLQQRKRKAEEQKVSSERQQLIKKWSTF